MELLSEYLEGNSTKLAWRNCVSFSRRTPNVARLLWSNTKSTERSACFRKKTRITLCARRSNKSRAVPMTLSRRVSLGSDRRCPPMESSWSELPNTILRGLRSPYLLSLHPIVILLFSQSRSRDLEPVTPAASKNKVKFTHTAQTKFLGAFCTSDRFRSNHQSRVYPYQWFSSVTVSHRR